MIIQIDSLQILIKVLVVLALKRYILLSLALFFLAGCNASDLSMSDGQDLIDVRNDEVKEMIPYNDDVQIIGLISKYDGDPFLDLIMDKAESMLFEEGFHVIRKSPYSYANTVDNQIKIMNEFILSGVDGIILIPNDAIKLNDVIRQALNNDIPVVIVDTPIDIEDLFVDEVNDELLSFVQIDNYQAAYNSASLFFESLEGSYKSVIISGDMNNPNAIQRREGVIRAIKESSRIELIETIDGGWQEHLAYNITQKVMTQDDETTMIICSNDRMAIGAIYALKEMGRLDSVIVSGFDGTDDAIKAIELGELAFTVKQDPTNFGISAVTTLRELMSDGATKRYHYVETDLIMEGNK